MASTPPSDTRAGAPIRVLLLEPEAGEAERLRAQLGTSGRFRVSHAARTQVALDQLDQEEYDIALVALSADEGTGSPVGRIRMVSPIPVVCLADDRSPQPAMEALQRGAHDCLLRGECDTPLLVRSLMHALERHQLLEELHSVRQRERFMATHDSLTGLPNRFFLEDQLRRAITRAARNEEQVGVLFLGLDRFRYLNDTLGHAAGDELLVQVAERLARSLSRGDLVARVGGDEFVVLLSKVPKARDAAGVARQLHELLTPAYRVEGRDCWVTPSVGISLFPRDAAEPELLLRGAYSAMRQVKARGGAGHSFYISELEETAVRRMDLETRLRRAIDQDELQLFYQPKVEIDSSRIIGAEALLRWTDAEIGVIEPKVVIPIAEETGLISEIAEWSLVTACGQNADWHRAGFGPLRMSVNLSPRQMTGDGIRESVVRALWDTGLDPSLLELEITESSLMRNEAVASRLLQELKEVGITVSLDDFGTGYSSLSYLKRFPVDVLKIDQSFVRDLAVDPDDAAIVRAIISIAEHLGLDVIAEGVETEEQRAFLSAHGCPEMQGFLMSPAVPAKEFTEMLEQQRKRME